MDGPANLDGPQGGMASTPVQVPIGGLGAIQDEIVVTLTLDKPITNLDFLDANDSYVEFGSDAAHLPEPGTIALLVLGGAILLRRGRRTA